MVAPAVDALSDVIALRIERGQHGAAFGVEIERWVVVADLADRLYDLWKVE